MHPPLDCRCGTPHFFREFQRSSASREARVATVVSKNSISVSRSVTRITRWSRTSSHVEGRTRAYVGIAREIGGVAISRKAGILRETRRHAETSSQDIFEWIEVFYSDAARLKPDVFANTERATLSSSLVGWRDWMAKPMPMPAMVARRACPLVTTQRRTVPPAAEAPANVSGSIERGRAVSSRVDARRCRSPARRSPCGESSRRLAGLQDRSA